MPTPEEINESVRGFLRAYPDAESPLRELLDRDRERSWTFDDVELDSGRFGELVARDIAAKTEDRAYRLRHPDAIEAALDGETVTATETAESNLLRSRLSVTVSCRELGGLVGALVIVVAARLFSFPAVFRDGYVVSPANDPYFYRYWQLQLLERSDGVTDLGLLADMGGAAGSRPLTHAVNWWLAELLGGTAGAATVAAWLPIVGAVLLGCVLYLLAKLLTDDARVGLAAVAFLGLAPIHVTYTNVGFLEHRLHQYLWLGVLALGLTWLAVDLQRRLGENGDGPQAASDHLGSPASWALAGVLALSVAASAHIWGGSPLTFIPVAIYLAVRVVVDMRADVPPIVANAPAIAGLALGSVLALGAHLAWGWHEPLAAGTPLLVTVGAVVVAGLAEGWRRYGGASRTLLIAEAAIGTLGLAVFWLVEPIDIARISRRVDDLLLREGATEAGSLFATEYAIVLGPLWQIGISFYFGFAALAVATLLVVRRYEPGWLVPSVFAWYYLFLAAFQSRFGAQLAFFIALFAGVGCVYLLATVDLARPTEPFDRSARASISSVSLPGGRRSGYVVGTVCLLLVFNFIFIPTLVGQTTYSDEQFEATLAIDEHAEEMDRTYPESAVETRWDRLRMYNFFVNGESRSYDSSYRSFMTDGHPDDQHTSLRQGGKYVVIDSISTSPGPAYEILYDGLGVGDGDVNDTSGRFQPVYIGDEVRAFTVVEGALLNVTGTDGENVTAATTVDIEDESIRYERHGVVSEGGTVIRVAHPGEYTVAGETVTVSEAAVYDGEEIRVDIE